GPRRDTTQRPGPGATRAGTSGTQRSPGRAPVLPCPRLGSGPHPLSPSPFRRGGTSDYAAAAAGAGPASTNCFVTCSTRKLNPSNVRAQQDEIARLPEDDLVPDPSPRDADHHRAGPP